MRCFLIALQFLTRLPVRLQQRPDASAVGRSVLCYPLVGLLIGLMLMALNHLLQGLPELLRAALLLTVWVGVTGGLHLDGLADSADAWLGGHGDRERTLAILKDPRAGPAAVVAVVLVLMIKFSALAAPATAAGQWGLILAPLLGRSALPLLFLTTPYVRPGGLGSAIASHLPRGAAMVVVAAVAATLAAAGKMGLGSVLTALIMFLGLRRLMLARIGGFTGDTAGALVCLVEAAVLGWATVSA